MGMDGALFAAFAFAVTLSLPPGGSGRNAGSRKPAYHGRRRFTIDFTEQKPLASPLPRGDGRSDRHVFLCGLQEGFIGVLDVLPAPAQDAGLDSVWQEVRIIFNAGHPPRQFTSARAVLAAAAAGEICLEPTTVVYRCGRVEADA